jgi:hypothetical protein
MSASDPLATFAKQPCIRYFKCMTRPLLSLSLVFILAVLGCGGWVWLNFYNSYQSLADCEAQIAIDHPADALAYAERMVHADEDVRRVSGIPSHNDFVRSVNCVTAQCKATTDGVYWDVWFNSLPKELSETWGGRVTLTRCRTHLRIWGA